MATTTTTISVPEIHCDHCVQSIQGAVSAIDGVDGVDVDLSAREVRVTHDADVAPTATLVDAIEDQGYEVPGDDGPARLPMA